MKLVKQTLTCILLRNLQTGKANIYMYSIKKYTNWLSPGSFSRKLHTLSSHATLYLPHKLCQWSNTILQRKIDNNDNNDNNIKKEAYYSHGIPQKRF